MEYIIELHNNDYVVPFGSIVDSSEYKKVFSELENVIEPLKQPMTEKAFYKKKENILEALQKMPDNKFKLETSVISYISNYKPESFLNYDELESLPKKIDLSQMTSDEISKYGKIAKGRLDALENIHTADEAYKDKDNLIGFMQGQDNMQENPVVEASQQCYKEETTLNFDTVIKISKKMENTKSEDAELYNEDSALYSAYLKIEEKRIWKLMQKRLLEYSESHDGIVPIYNLTEDIREKENLADPSEDVVSYDIFQHIINEVHELNKGAKNNNMHNTNIENYLKNIYRDDLKLYNAVETKCTDMNGQEEILEYLTARKSCLGQLSKSSQKESLRNFVAETEFKDPDDNATKNFLLVVAKSEKQYIQQNYNKLIEEYEKTFSKTNENKFKNDIKVNVSNNIEKSAKNNSDRNIERE